MRAFFDTNIFVYADDAAAGDKRQRALARIDEHVRAGTAVLSTQVLQEFYVVATRRLGVPIDVARDKVALLARLDVVPIDTTMILQAIDAQRLHQLSFWDALIVQAATTAGCRLLFSEDLPDGRTFHDLRVVNPMLA